LAKFPCLKVLSFGDKGFTGDGLEHLAALGSLSVLHIWNSPQLIDLSALVNMASLRVLDISGCRLLNDASLEQLRLVKGLRGLLLPRKAAYSGEALKALREALPDCKVYR
jgi:hypothetical protein